MRPMDVVLRAPVGRMNGAPMSLHRSLNWGVTTESFAVAQPSAELADAGLYERRAYTVRSSNDAGSCWWFEAARVALCPVRPQTEDRADQPAEKPGVVP
jgi:hypothetical protein